MYNYMSNREILSALNETVEGHLTAKKVLINLLQRSKVRHYQKFETGMYPEFLLAPSKVLLMAESGTGKTHLVESLQQVIPFPLVRIAATDLTHTGAGGGIKLDDLKETILTTAKRYAINFPMNVDSIMPIESACDQTVVFVDEFDKLAGSFDGSSSGRWNTGTQAHFLTLFDNKDTFAGVSFIFAGAFSELTKRDSRPKPSLGFAPTVDSTTDESPIDEALVKFGLIPEIVGRINHIVQLDAFNEDDFYHILMTRLLPKKRIDMAYLGVYDIDISEEQGRGIARKAIKSGQGIRAMHREVEAMFVELEFDCEKMLPRLDFSERESDFDKFLAEQEGFEEERE